VQAQELAEQGRSGEQKDEADQSKERKLDNYFLARSPKRTEASTAVPNRQTPTRVTAGTGTRRWNTANITRWAG
jgi:hypothetical protein